MATPELTETIDLALRFPGAVSIDARPGFTGWMVEKESLLQVATFIRDDLGYDLLSSLTGVDYIEQNKLEVVYHTYKTTGGPALVFKTQCDRIDPAEVP